MNNNCVRNAISNERLKENISGRGEIAYKKVFLQGCVTEDNADHDVRHLKMESITKSCKASTQLATQETVYNDVAKEHDLNLAYISDSIPNVISRNEDERHNEGALNRVNNPYTEAVSSWERISSQICRLCACTNELHPKQSIVGWLGLLNEILPGVVSIFIFPT